MNMTNEIRSNGHITDPLNPTVIKYRLKSRYGNFFIRFPNHPELLEKLPETEDTKISKLSDSKIGSSKYGYSEIRAENLKVFFKAIELLQASNPELFVSSDLSQKILHILERVCLITPKEAKKYQSKTISYLTIGQFEQVAERTRDYKMALAIVEYYSQHNRSNHFKRIDCIKWLLTAKDYLGKEGRLSDSIDLEGFIKGLNLTECTSDIFSEAYDEIAKAFEKANTIKKMDIVDSKVIPRAVEFLKITKSVEQVIFHCQCPESIEVIADALRINTSLEYLDLWKTGLSDEDVIKLIKSIENNSESKIIQLWLCNDNLSDEGLNALLRFIQNNEQIRHIRLTAIRNSAKLEASDRNPIEKSIRKLCTKRKVNKY